MPRKSKELTTTADKELAVPSFLQSYQGDNGVDGIDSEDVAIPRLKLAQALTPDVQEGTLKAGDLFLNVTGEVLASEDNPLRIIPVAVGKEYILWNPERGEGILARAKRVFHGGRARYQWDNQDQIFDVKFRKGPAVRWETKRFVEDNGLHRFGSSIPGDPSSGPAATAHHNFVCVLPDHDNMVVALSLSRSQEKKAKDLNTMLKMSKMPIYGRVFTVATTRERNASGDEYFNYQFKPAGFVQDEQAFLAYKEIFESFNLKGFNVDQDGAAPSTETEPDEIPF